MTASLIKPGALLPSFAHTAVGSARGPRDVPAGKPIAATIHRAAPTPIAKPTPKEIRMPKKPKDFPIRGQTLTVLAALANGPQSTTELMASCDMIQTGVYNATYRLRLGGHITTEKLVHTITESGRAALKATPTGAAPLKVKKESAAGKSIRFIPCGPQAGSGLIQPTCRAILKADGGVVLLENSLVTRELTAAHVTAFREELARHE